MIEKHLRAIDLNLLPVLEALLRHRNATRAGAEVGLSQPAMSRALGRLRDLLDDPLLVRSPGGTMLSPRAELMRQPLAALLSEVRALLIASPFEPASELRTLRLAMTDATAELLLAPLVQRLSVDAPNITLEWVPVSQRLPDQMRAGEVDLTFALDKTPLPPGTSSEPLLEDILAVVVREGHPCQETWTMEHYGVYPSVIISLLGDRASEIDAALAAAGVERTTAAIVPTFRAAAEIVAVTDNVTTISRAFADRLKVPLRLKLLESPLRNARLGMVTVWMKYRDSDPVLTWVRGILREISHTIRD